MIYENSDETVEDNMIYANADEVIEVIEVTDDETVEDNEGGFNV